MIEPQPPTCSAPAPGVALDVSAQGTVTAIPDEIAHSAQLLATAATDVGDAVWALRRCWSASIFDARTATEVEALRAHATDLAAALSDLSAQALRAANGYTDADTRGYTAAAAVGESIGDHPVPGLGLLAFGAGLLVAAVETAVVVEVVAGDPHPIGDGVSAVAGLLTQDGHAAAVTGLFSGLLDGLRLGPAPPMVTVPTAAGQILSVVGAPPPAVTRPLDAAPDLPAPTTLADLMRSVDAAYDDPAGNAVVLVQRLVRSDGSVGWVVSIPGTQSAGFGGRTPTDLTTDLQIVAGQQDQMTAGVLAAMASAGVGRNDPVLLTGHSLGGMVAQSVATAAAPTYDIRSVVTFGSPLLDRPIPAGVALTTLAERPDGVPQLSGSVRVPVAPGRLVITGDLDAGTIPGPVRAHAQPGYLTLAERSDEALAEQGRDVPGMRAVTDGVVSATTRAYQVVRDPVGS